MKKIVLTLSCSLFCIISSICAQEPVFNKPHGLYTSLFILRISTPVKDGSIYYTEDGSDPRVNGTLYEGSIGIRTSSIIRAATLKPDSTWSKVSTVSYIFPQSVLTQSNSPEGYPQTWGKYCEISGTAPADYGMDTELMSDPAVKVNVQKGLYSLPIVSLVTDKDNFFGKTRDEKTGGIFIFTGCPVGDGIGRGWERPVSMEFFGGPEDHDLTVDCCVKLHGGHGRLPEKNPKHAMRLHFKREYGPNKLRYPVFGERGGMTHNALVLRTFFGYSWQHWDNSQRYKAQYSRDLWARFTQQKMGHPISLGQYVHLFINGMYWGMYNMCERISEDFCAEKFGGEPEDWDITEVDGKAGQNHAAIPVAGNTTAWNLMEDYIYAIPSDKTAYLHLTGRDDNGQPAERYPVLLDVENFIDYMLINYYAGNSDWDHHNWYAYRNRNTPERGFRFFCWDSEAILDNSTENNLSRNNRGCPTGFMPNLMKSPIFVHLFHERAQKALFHGGALTPKTVVETWDSLYHTIELALYDESARWGDYRRDVHPYSSKGELYTVDGHYQKERKRLLENYFPYRTNTLVRQLRSMGWFPSTSAPDFYVDGTRIGYRTTEVSPENTFSMEGKNIFFTTDGSAPATWDISASGTLSPTAQQYNSGEDILETLDWNNVPDTLTIKAICNDNSVWSPIVTVKLVMQRPNSVTQPTTQEPSVQQGIFDLSGRRIPANRLPQKRGIYIVNGKKTAF